MPNSKQKKQDLSMKISNWYKLTLYNVHIKINLPKYCIIVQEREPIVAKKLTTKENVSCQDTSVDVSLLYFENARSSMGINKHTGSIIIQVSAH